MIQFTKEFRKELARQERIEKCLSYFAVVTEPAMTESGYITYTVVNSTSTSGRRYLVFIDESGNVPVAERCNCDATVRCIHMDSVDVYYQRIAAMFVHDEPEVELTPDEIAAIAEEANIQKLAEYRRHTHDTAHETLGATKHVHCGGCHQICGEDKGDRCKPGFCFWNSFWTEAQRNAA